MAGDEAGLVNGRSGGSHREMCTYCIKEFCRYHVGMGEPLKNFEEG